MRGKSVLYSFTVLGALFVLLTQAWATRGIEPQLVQDNATYCQNWQAELDSKIDDFHASCIGQPDRACSQWKTDLDVQTARFTSHCPG